jgi:nitroreductase
MIIAVFSRPDLDCRVRGRDYYLFDTGMAVAFLILRATELGLVAHPIAGYNEEKVKKILGIPEDMKVIILVNIGKHSDTIKDFLSETHKKAERTRPERRPLEEIGYIDRFNG